MRTLARFMDNRAQGISGIAAVEFAIIAPPLLLMMVCTADLGFGMYRKLQVQNAAQAGAEYAIANGYYLTSISTAVTNATAMPGISAQPAPKQFYGCISNGVVVSATYGLICSDGTTAGNYVTVAAQGSYTTLVPYPVLPNTFNFASTSTVRIQ